MNIHLLGELRGEVDTCLQGLLSQGFAADRSSLLSQSVAAVGEQDILVVTGRYRREFHMAAQLSKLVGSHRDRTILFLSNLEPASFSLFERAGFPFINVTTDQTVKSLVGLIAEVDPQAVYQASKTAAMRASVSNRVAHSVVDLFSRLRGTPQAPSWRSPEASSGR